MRRALLTFILAMSASPLAAQAAPPGPRASDVKSMDAIIAALYEVISGPAGQQRDWDRMRNLFVPGARSFPRSTVPTACRHSGN
jgi:hypothetical protein